MTKRHSLRFVLAEFGGSLDQRLELAALVNLGMVQSLAGGVLSPVEAVERFYHADNCLFAKTQLRNRDLNEVMSRGTQLPDPFEALPADAAQRQFLHELEAMRSLCLRLLERIRSARAAGHAAA